MTYNLPNAVFIDANHHATFGRYSIAKTISVLQDPLLALLNSNFPT